MNVLITAAQVGINHSARIGCNINLKEWEITNNNLNVEVSDVKECSQ
jgi:hypothetical protein